jgi:hypothetical protein
VGLLPLNPMTIFSLQRRISYDLALRKLSPSGPLGALRQWVAGPLRGVAEIHIPCRLYKISANDRRFRSVRYYAVDAAAGTLDPYEFAVPPEAADYVAVETRNFHPVCLDETQTHRMVTEKVRRLLYSRGFFRMVNPKIIAQLLRPEFYIPYWAGFYGDERNISLTVLNAVRETVEGQKLRELVQAWLADRQAPFPSGEAATQAQLFS